MIEIKGLNKQFGKLKVLDDVNLSFNRGECIALIGPNGCGKTTLIKSILGMVLPNSGEILFNGKSIKGNHQYRSEIGYMPQIGKYPENMSIDRVVNTVKHIRQYQMITDDELMNKFKIAEMLEKKMKALSGGTTQKVSACLAFMFHPNVLILDEPTAGLDPLASEILKEKIIKEKENGKLILITSHLLSELDEMVNKVVFMQEGKVRLSMEVSALMELTGELKLSKAIAHLLKQDSKEHLKQKV